MLTVTILQNATRTPGDSARFTSVELSENAMTMPTTASTPNALALSARVPVGEVAVAMSAVDSVVRPPRRAHDFHCTYAVPGAGRPAASGRANDGATRSSARRPARQPPVPAAEDRDERGGEDAADERRVEQDAAAERGREHLGLGARAGAHGDEGQAEDQRRARDQPAGAADALDDRRLGRAGAVVGLAHPADDEHLVVHRDAEQEGEDDDRHLDVDRAAWPRCPRSRPSRSRAARRAPSAPTPRRRRAG